MAITREQLAAKQRELIEATVREPMDWRYRFRIFKRDAGLDEFGMMFRRHETFTRKMVNDLDRPNRFHPARGRRKA